MSYREYRPAPALAPFVECYWTSDAPVRAGRKRVMPDGCADIIFGASDFVAGTMSRAHVVEIEPGIEFLGVRFHPGAAGLFIGDSMHALLDCDVPLRELKGPLRNLGEQLREHAGVAERIALLNRRLPAFAAAADHVRLVTSAARHLASRSHAPIGAAAAALGVTVRTLERTFSAHVGLPPRMLARVLRLRRAVDAVHRLPGLAAHEADWHDVVHAAGYYDQAHMIHEFRSLAGVTPSEYLREFVASIQFSGAPAA